MQKCEPIGAGCRLEHQGPTSHEVGMEECEPIGKSQVDMKHSDKAQRGEYRKAFKVR
jgi:hypothetical protein